MGAPLQYMNIKQVNYGQIIVCLSDQKPFLIFRPLISGFRKGYVCPRLLADQALEDANFWKCLNAFITLTPEYARKQAQESSERYQKQNSEAVNSKHLLDGVTIAIKDNFCTKEITTTCASKMLENFIPPYNATVYERLTDAGAVLIGKTNMDQFAMGSGTVDSIYGPAKNIWSKNCKEEDNWHIAGGSSGGSALAVASGICYGSIGSDTGGSTRNPASYCGVVGLKPTYGLLSRHGLIPLVNSMDVPGIFTRTIADCAEILNVIAGPDVKDSTTINMPFRKLKLIDPNNFDIGAIRIGVPEEYHCSGLSREVHETWQKVADLFENAGARVKRVSLPHTELSIIVYSILNQCEVASNMARYDGIQYGHRSILADNKIQQDSTEELYARTRSEGFNDVVKSRILTGNYFLLKRNYQDYFEKALRVRRLISEDFQNVFKCGRKTVSGIEDKGLNAEGVDILLTPTTLSVAPLYKDFILSTNRDQCALQDFCTQSANMAGIPAISIPISLNINGLPISVQLMANSLNEELLLNVAQWLETKVNFTPYPKILMDYYNSKKKEKIIK